jgi:centromeric protein E
MNGTSKQPGVIPLAVYDCFTLIEEYTDREFLFRATYLEVYNEQVKDLLNPDPIASGNIKIQHDPRAGTVISGIREQVVANAQQVMALLQGGESHRHVGSTNMNEKSSRAHTIFRMKVESKERFANTSVRISTLNLIDLAGSENARMTGSTGDRAKEAKFINQSLLTLSLIIQRLSEESSTAKRQHLPYRDSKLTRILQEPLSGNALIAIICTMSPALRCADESNNTLRFATRAKKVKVAAATVNEDVDDKALLQAYRREIEQLKAKLAEQESSVPMTQMVRSIDPDEEEKREKLLQVATTSNIYSFCWLVVISVDE